MTPEEIVEKMYNNDDFSKWLGIERVKISPGHCILRMTVRKEMTNGFDIAHGGISYSFADSAFAFASNSRGRIAVSIETSISHTAAIHSGDTLTATAVEENLSNKLGQYRIKVTNQHDEVVALFRGTVYRKAQEWTG
ncbi:MAG: hydroxyphenylacetyl-CoA thioesterase PaaI [Saprospiraceae bacterium]|nr:hydroxyphenylacetyl-CoA thioesterase PaaI [Bacteroidia bacterium]NNK89694.1 hydroxyphenylacetyl-CoA thioesterase PaaI [Saprospiraceae bacterium]